MKPKFKIGDKVKTLKGGYIGKEYIIEKIGFNYYKDELVYSGSGSDFYDYELELVSTSEQLAVEKFKEELKNKIIKLKYDYINHLPVVRIGHILELLESKDK